MYPAQSQRYPPSKPPRPSLRAAPYPARGGHPPQHSDHRQAAGGKKKGPRNVVAHSVEHTPYAQGSFRETPYRHKAVKQPSASVVVPDRHAHPREIIGPTPEPSDGYTAASDEELARIKRIVAKTQMVEELTQEVVDIFISAGSSGAVASPLLNHGGGTNQLM